MQPGTSYRYVELLALALLPLLVEAERVSTYMICLVFVCKLHVQFIFVYYGSTIVFAKRFSHLRLLKL